jgi:hypothetical protein
MILIIEDIGPSLQHYLMQQEEPTWTLATLLDAAGKTHLHSGYICSPVDEIAASSFNQHHVARPVSFPGHPVPVQQCIMSLK